MIGGMIYGCCYRIDLPGCAMDGVMGRFFPASRRLTGRYGPGVAFLEAPLCARGMPLAVDDLDSLHFVDKPTDSDVLWANQDAGRLIAPFTNGLWPLHVQVHRSLFVGSENENETILWYCDNKGDYRLASWRRDADGSCWLVPGWGSGRRPEPIKVG